MRAVEFEPKWEERLPIAFGRYNGFCSYWNGGGNRKLRDGSKHPCTRQHLANVSNDFPDVLDVGPVGSKTRNNTTRNFMPIAEQRKYRYIISTDGWSISPKLERYMLLGSAILKEESQRISWFYGGILPYEHYVPFMNYNNTDIVNQVRWLRDNDELARRIAKNAQEFALAHLTRQGRQCYLFHLMNELGARVRYKAPPCTPSTCFAPEKELQAYVSRRGDVCHPNTMLKQLRDMGFDTLPPPPPPAAAAGKHRASRVMMS